MIRLADESEGLSLKERDIPLSLFLRLGPLTETFHLDKKKNVIAKQRVYLVTRQPILSRAREKTGR